VTPGQDGGNAIELSGVRVRLGGAVILDDVNLQVRRGEFLALIGPSGGGKSTLLRVIGGLLTPEAGQVRVSNAARLRVPGLPAAAVADGARQRAPVPPT